MRSLLTNLTLFAGLFFCLSSCHYFCDCEEEPKPCLFQYEKLLYTPSDSGEHLIQPHFDNERPDGTFSAHSDGLKLDAHTGEIDVNASHPGEYTVVYTLDDGKTTCETVIVIGKRKEEPKVTECDLRYSEDGNNVFFANEDKPQLIRPLGEFENPDNFEGRFTVWPQGLDIDPVTGVIDVNVSEPGLTYQVTFTSEDGLTACTTQVTIGGLDYRDAILDFDGAIDGDFIEENPSIREFIIVDSIVDPVFNFQSDNLDFGIVSADEELVFVEGRSSASVDIKATLRNVEGIESGFFQEFTFVYEYNPPFGERTRSEAEIVIYYYRSAEEIPPSLLDLLGRKERVPDAENGRLMHRHPVIVGVGAL